MRSSADTGKAAGPRKKYRTISSALSPIALVCGNGKVQSQTQIPPQAPTIIQNKAQVSGFRTYLRSCVVAGLSKQRIIINARVNGQLARPLCYSTRSPLLFEGNVKAFVRLKFDVRRLLQNVQINKRNISCDSGQTVKKMNKV